MTAYPKWMKQASCVDADPEQFYPDQGVHSATAYLLCGGCEVRTACATYAVEAREPGIWGGTSERGRQQVRSGRMSLVQALRAGDAIAARSYPTGDTA